MRNGKQRREGEREQPRDVKKPVAHLAFQEPDRHAAISAEIAEPVTRLRPRRHAPRDCRADDASGPERPLSALRSVGAHSSLFAFPCLDHDPETISRRDNRKMAQARATLTAARGRISGATPHMPPHIWCGWRPRSRCPSEPGDIVRKAWRKAENIWRTRPRRTTRTSRRSICRPRRTPHGRRRRPDGCRRRSAVRPARRRTERPAAADLGARAAGLAPPRPAPAPISTASIPSSGRPSKRSTARCWFSPAPAPARRAC